MNFFHFDGAEMTLRHLTLFGVSNNPSFHSVSEKDATFPQVAGWPRFFDMLNDLWTPDVKATQLADVVSGVSPIRSVVNVGSGVADLVLLPIAQYRKDGRVVRGLQKGTKAFVRSTAMEAVKLGAQLATGTQVILEQAENVLGSKFNETILAETVSHPSEDAVDTGFHDSASDEEVTDPISRYAEQPVDIREGIQSAYTSMRRNLSSAAQTILAVPMEVFERSGTEACIAIFVLTRDLTYLYLGTRSCCY
jgi:autophagy-related protein 2